jgi:hypothetical protein
MFFEVSSLTYHSPITIDIVSCRMRWMDGGADRRMMVPTLNDRNVVEIFRVLRQRQWVWGRGECQQNAMMPPRR